MRAGLLINRASRRGRQWARLAAPLLAARGIEVVEAIYANNGREIAAGAERLAGLELPLVVLGGGDGTVGAAATHFASRDVTIALLPLGTGNALARDLDIPADLARACEIAADGVDATIDLGMVGDLYFVNLLTAGVTTLIARNLNPDAKKRFGRLAYFTAVLRAFREAKPFEVELTLDGQVHRFPSLQVVVGSGRLHAGPFPVTASASICDGKLSVYALKSTQRRDLLSLARHLANGTHGQLESVISAEVESGSLHTEPTVRVATDGEVRLRTPVEFRVAAGALRVRVPAPLAV